MLVSFLAFRDIPVFPKIIIFFFSLKFFPSIFYQNVQNLFDE